MQAIEVKGTRVAFLDEGDGQPVILLHSSTGSKGQWRDAFAAWQKRYRVIAPDLLGYGETGPFAGRQPHRLLDEVRIAAAMIARAGRPVHLVGHSYGGAVALQTALELGPQIASLSLIEPTAFYLLAQASALEPQAPDALAEITAVVSDIEQALAAGFPLAAAHRFVDYWCGDGAWLRLPSERKWRISSQMQKVRHDFHTLLREETALARVAALAVPTLILCGTNSPRPTRCLSRLIATSVAGAHHRSIARAGHMLPITHSEPVNAVVLEHAARVDRQRRAQASGLAADAVPGAKPGTSIDSPPHPPRGRHLAQA